MTFSDMKSYQFGTSALGFKRSSAVDPNLKTETDYFRYTNNSELGSDFPRSKSLNRATGSVAKTGRSIISFDPLNAVKMHDSGWMNVSDAMTKDRLE